MALCVPETPKLYLIFIKYLRKTKTSLQRERSLFVNKFSARTRESSFSFLRKINHFMAASELKKTGNRLSPRGGTLASSTCKDCTLGLYEGLCFKLRGAESIKKNVGTEIIK